MKSKVQTPNPSGNTFYLVQKIKVFFLKKKKNERKKEKRAKERERQQVTVPDKNRTKTLIANKVTVKEGAIASLTYLTTF